MKTSKKDLVTPAPLTLFNTLLINTVAALGIQIFFIGSLAPVVRKIFDTPGLSSYIAHELFVKAILEVCFGTAITMLVVEFVIEHTPIFDANSAFEREMNRAVYFSVVGLLGIGAMLALKEELMSIAFMYFCGMIGLFALDRYRSKFREPRKDNWFPHATFHVIGQYAFFAYPGFWILDRLIG